ncbi:MAG: hypothetical protein LBL75_02165 [Rickettsiales bacterium]|jgi:chromosomal replication initiator protein|nr:hypothetical protein [Rickettsiales bacterium]
MQVAVSKQIIANADSVKNSLRQILPNDVYETWFAPLKISVVENNLNVHAQNQFSADFITRSYSDVLESVASEFGLCLFISVSASVAKIQSVNDNVKCEFIPVADTKTTPSLDFSAFITSDENSFAVAAARQVANLSANFSPLFIHGAPASGKSHLCACINGAARGRTLMMTGAGFVSEFLRAITQKSVFAFKDFCRNCDVFIMDDVQAIAGKRACTDEFISLLVDLIANKKAIVLTANSAPSQITGFDRRIQSVLASGLSVDLVAPSVSTRRAMLVRSGMSNTLAESVATKLPANAHIVMGAAKKMSAYAELMGEKITDAVAEKLLSDVLQKNKTPTMMIRAMCDKMGVSVDSVCGNSRTRGVVRARQIIMAALRGGTKMSLSEIGRALGDKNHATILYGLNQIDAACKTDLLLNAEIAQMTAECR